MSTDIKRATHKLVEANEYLDQLYDLLQKAQTIVGIVRVSINGVTDALLEEEASQ